ncbi:U4/U6 small nuclear ribonucleoprotein Prp3 [Ischnura elegans]|uniref:U4/U6 small nuclear ribonucleoprotein Prp3 n=1 Tax=Ischnura elegans TaxID=197161 RepID=UPI001ED87483|nr:U4/U6 small nuclear ribonucleoprotein Prp3 [Ischnura elegans]XP_046396427.1 U4/U6 small nuclear ribonucleoprotein Prp3 [Ischnura elegans]XP_046396428.1 U4/U6 small nuclear ribonucleoprotein Prp3 [Ischnura elegans]XP_046396429.1 U4/U6 small nuclear ribonucleoprotein Prp3 [Ischnura elegans]XP_046396430.1 U4/U6 small nuclear ribonucleoprotein Prp3 [Ischnura elegans]
MTTYLSRKDIEEMKPSLDKTVQKFLGFNEPSLVTAAINCLVSGYDRRKTTDKLASLLDNQKASRLTDKIFDMIEETKGITVPNQSQNNSSSSQSRSSKKRTRDGNEGEDAGSTTNSVSKEEKRSKTSDDDASATLPPVGQPSPGQLTALQIKEMMANAQRMIEERKKALTMLRVGETGGGGGGGISSAAPPADLFSDIQVRSSSNSSSAPPSSSSSTSSSNRRSESEGGGSRSNGSSSSSSRPSSSSSSSRTAQPPVDTDKARKIAELQAQIQSKLSSGLLSMAAAAGVQRQQQQALVLGQQMAAMAAQQGPHRLPPPPLMAVVTGMAHRPTMQQQQPKHVPQPKPAPLILDSEGRTVDVTGKEVQLTHRMPTLKANIRAKKREEFRQQLQERAAEDLSETTFFDSRLGNKPPVRGKRALRFHEPGKFTQMADRMRVKAQLEKLQNEISQIARKTGITSATKLALIAPKAEATEDEIPDSEWWDSVILRPDCDKYEEINGKIGIRPEGVTNLVEHPTQMRPPTDPLKPVYMPVFLTKKERKKLRRQNRREAWKEEQEKIRLGLEPPPEPKLRMSNLMRVLGTEAVADPTKIEGQVREQMAKRLAAHREANAARALTAQQKKDKRARKIQEDVSLGVNVAIYRVKDLTNPAKKFKVEANAKQLTMTGCVVLFRDCNVIAVEGGLKQQKHYKRLMLHRIKWEEDMTKDLEGKETPNKCHLVWEGFTKQRNFGELKFKVCPTEKVAREHFKKHSVEHYWDLAYSGAVMETADTPL